MSILTFWHLEQVRREIRPDDVTAQPDALPKHCPPTPAPTDITWAIYRSQRSNYGARFVDIRMSCRCAHYSFLPYSLPRRHEPVPLAANTQARLWHRLIPSTFPSARRLHCSNHEGSNREYRVTNTKVYNGLWIKLYRHQSVACDAIS